MVCKGCMVLETYCGVVWHSIVNLTIVLSVAVALSGAGFVVLSRILSS